MFGITHGTLAARRYHRRSGITAIAYIALVAANAAIPHVFSPPRVWVVAMAVASALPIVSLLVLLAVYLHEETDEYVRNRTILAMLLATGAVLVFSSVLGMLQIGGLLGPAPIFLVFIVWACAWGIAKVWLEWRDRREMATP